MRLGRRCAQLALAGLMALGLGPAAQAQAPQTLVVKDGQSATEIALDEVPPGTTMDQFLLALYRLNPQAFVGGDLNRLLAQARLVLPTAEQANQVNVALAREELAKIRNPGAAPAASAGPAAIPSPIASEPAATAPAPAPEASARIVAPSAPAPSTSPAELPWLLGAVVALAAVGLWRLKRQPAPPVTQATAEAEQPTQGRFQPVLPGEPPPPPAKTAPVAPKPALFDLDLNLDGSAPPLDLPKPSGLGKLPDLDLGRAAPKAATPGPLDLSGLSLDLDSPPPPKDKP